MPEVLLLCEYPTLNGGEQSILAMLPGVQAAGWTPVALAPPQGPLADRFRALAIEIEPFAACDATGARRRQSDLRQSLAELMQRRRPVLVHANSLAMGRLCGPVTAACGVSSLSHLRDILRLPRQGVADLNCHRRLLAVSAATRAAHVAQGVDAARTHVLHNGVDLERLRPRTASGYLHRELSLPADARLAAVIGQIGLRKGLDVVMAAMQNVHARWPQLHLLVVGQRHSEKEESRALERGLRAAAAKLDGCVHFLGWRSDVERLLPELTLLVHAARQEPLGRVLLEAAASGSAVVATDVGGTREIFPAESPSALLVPPDDAAALAAAIERVMADATLRHALGAAARRRAETAFDRKLALAGLLRHYAELTAD